MRRLIVPQMETGISMILHMLSCVNWIAVIRISCRKFGRLQIPTLREYLEWMAEEEDLITNIELKNSVYYYGGMEEKVIDMICEYGLEDRIILSSFNNASIVLCRQSDETIAGGFLVEKYVDNAGFMQEL